MGKRYFKHKIENLLNVNDIVTIHYLELGKGFHHPAETHNFWELVYVDKENVTVNCNGKDVIVNEGEILFHKPNEPHSLFVKNEKAPNVFVVSFAVKSHVMRFFENKKIKLSKNLIRFIYLIAEEGKKTFNLPYFNPELTKMELLESPALGGQQLIKNYLEILLISLLRSETEKENSQDVFLTVDKNQGNITSLIIAYLKERINDKVTIEDLCEKLNYNKSYVFRIFKKDTNTTIMKYFLKLKIERSKQLLREGKLNVTQIAEILAFESPNYFSKTFKKITNYTPKQYKKIYLSSSK